MSQVAKEDLEALRKRKYKLIFVLGGPGTGKGTQCAKLVTEFKYNHISTGDLIREEIAKKSKLGLECVSYTSQGKLVPFELIISLLIKAILVRQGTNFLIDGFPRSMEQALYLDKYIKDIRIILNIHASEDVSLDRILGRSVTSGRADDANEATIRTRLKEFADMSFPVIDFYHKYGVVRDINSELDVAEVYEIVKQQLFPEIYCIIGKKYSGKTEISKALSTRMQAKLIDFKKFLNDPYFNKKAKTDETVITHLINTLREEDCARVIIEDFPLKKEYYNLFVKNCKKFRKIFYLNVDDNISSERMNRIGIDHHEYIGCSRLNKELYDFDKNKEILSFLKTKSNFSEINVNNHFNIVFQRALAEIAPQILIFNSDEANTQFLNETLIEYFKSPLLGYKTIDAGTIVQEAVDRHTPVGQEIAKYQEDMKRVPNRLVIAALKSVLFKETHDKYILTNYRASADNFAEFEKEVCKIQKYIYVSQTVPLPIEDLDSEVPVYFKQNNRFYVYTNQFINEYLINEILDKNRNFNIVFGLPLSGKTMLNNYLEKNYNHRIIDLNKFIEQIKIIKAGAEEDPESITVDIPMFMEEFKKLVNTIDLKEKICIENLFNAVITEDSHAQMVIDVLGRPRFFYNLVTNDSILLDRYRVKNELGEEISDEQKEDYEKTLEYPKKIIDYLKNTAYKTIELNTSLSEYKTQQIFESSSGRTIIALKHEYSIDLEAQLNVIAMKYRILYVNVAELLYKQFELGNEWADLLAETYNKKPINIDNLSRNNSDKRKNYYEKYNPINFDESLVKKIILKYINDNSKEMEDSDNLVILSGFLNSDLLPETELSNNLPLYDIKRLLELGYLSAFVQLSYNNVIETEETDEPVLLEPEIKVKEVKKDPLDISGEGNNEEGKEAEEEAPKEEEQEELEEGEQPKFKPEGYYWTDYDGKPRNYVQIVKRYNKYPVEELNTLSNHAETAVQNVITNIIIEKKNTIAIIHVTK